MAIEIPAPCQRRCIFGIRGSLLAVKATVLLRIIGEKVIFVQPFLNLPLFNCPQSKLLGVRRVKELIFNFPGFTYCQNVAFCSVTI